MRYQRRQSGNTSGLATIGDSDSGGQSRINSGVTIVREYLKGTAGGASITKAKTAVGAVTENDPSLWYNPFADPAEVPKHEPPKFALTELRMDSNRSGQSLKSLSYEPLDEEKEREVQNQIKFLKCILSVPHSNYSTCICIFCCILKSFRTVPRNSQGQSLRGDLEGLASFRQQKLKIPNSLLTAA